MLVFPAFAEVAPDYYMTDTQYADDGSVIVDDGTVPTDAIQTPDQTVPQQTVPATQPAAPVAPAVVTPPPTPVPLSAAQAVAGRAAVTRGAAVTRAVAAQQNGMRMVAQRGVASRPAAIETTAPSAVNNIPTTPAANRRVATGPDAMAARAASSVIVQTDTVNKPLYNPTGTAGTSATGSSIRMSSSTYTPSNLTMNTSSSLRTSAMRSASTGATATGAATGPTADEIAQLSDFCKAQYYSCMDGFCAVLDDNQGRCSCSSDVAQFQKAEDALKQATFDLNDIAFKIKTLGLSKDEVTAMFQQTDAEKAMAGVTDTSQLKSDLDQIMNMIVDIKPATNATSADMGFSIDFSALTATNFDLGTGFDLSALFGGNSTTSISGQRGAELYKTAAARCQAAVLTDCKNQGIDTSVITNQYDIEIDRQCKVYERSLQDSNDKMKRMIQNAKIFLQVARLQVAQNKNKYATMPDCVTALDKCMQNDFVCGTNYVNCLDPTGSYLANGRVIVGSKPGTVGGTTGLYSVWTEGTAKAWGDGGNLANFIAVSISNSQPTNSSANIAKFLNYKIGYHDATNGDTGNCISVLNQCQALTYTGSGKVYRNDNAVIITFLNRVLVDIKAQQDTILANHAQSCISDVGQCLARQNINVSGTQTTISGAAIAACNSIIATCQNVNNIMPTQTALDFVAANGFLACTTDTAKVVNGAVTCP